MAKKTYTTDDAIADVVASFEKFMQTLAGKGGKVSSSQIEDDEPEDDEDEEEAELDALDREETEGLSIKELRSLAKDYLGEDAPTKKADILEALEEFYEDDEDEEVEEDEDEDDEDEDGEFDRDDLEEKSLKELRAIAKDEGHSSSEYRGMDQDALIDLILGEEDEGEEEDDEDEDEEVEELDEDALKAMSHKELITLAADLEIKVPKALTKSTKPNQKKLVELILDSGDDE